MFKRKVGKNNIDFAHIQCLSETFTLKKSVWAYKGDGPSSYFKMKLYDISENLTRAIARHVVSDPFITTEGKEWYNLSCENMMRHEILLGIARIETEAITLAESDKTRCDVLSYFFVLNDK